MSGTDEGADARASRLRRAELNLRATFATLMRAPRGPISRPTFAQLAIATAASAAAILATMALLDARLLAATRYLPQRLVQAFDDFTDYGRSGWFLWPIGLLLLAVILMNSPAANRVARGVLAAWGVRLGFLFAAIAVPGLFVTIVKRLIGRARPFVAGDNVWVYLPFGWRVDYASFPSGHATTGFSALVAIGALFPAARPLLWIYAILIAMSRVIVTAHHPSDVVAGALVGALGAWLTRDWFAARRLGFSVDTAGNIHPKPGPSVRRIVKAVARQLRSA